MRPITILSTTLAALVLGAGMACANTFLDATFGTPQGGGTPRSLGMGSTGVSLRQGSDALFFNPAVMITGPAGLALDVAGDLTMANEDRQVPLFDTFNSFVTETTVALNHNFYGAGNGGGIYRLPGSIPMALGAGVFERYDFDYDYFEEFRNPNSRDVAHRDEVLQNRTIGQEGRLWSFSPGLAAEVLPHVNLGASVHRYFGSASRDVRVTTVQTGRRQATHDERDLAGWGWSVGAWGRANERVDLGASFEGPFKLDGTLDHQSIVGTGPVDTVTAVSSSRSADYPGTLRFGATYHPRNRLRTTLALEMERRFWKSLDEPTLGVLGDTVQVRDTWDFRIGLEHVFYNDLPVRFGFRYLENYADSESERSIYSAGLGYKVAGFGVDVTGLLTRQTSRQPFLFDPSYLTFQAPGSSEKVEDTVVQVVLGLSRTF